MSNEDIVFNAAIINGMPPYLAALIVAQAKHESANFTSNIFLNCNNAFGFGTPSWNFNPCAYSSFFNKYNSLADSTNDLCEWIKRKQDDGLFPTNLSSINSIYKYASLLKNAGYYTDSLENYTNGLTAYFKPAEDYKNENTAGIGFFLL